MADKSIKKKRRRRNAKFTEAESEPKLQRERSKILRNGLVFDAQKYEFSDQWVPGNPLHPKSVHSLPELVECLKENKDVDIEARVICAAREQGEGYKLIRFNKNQFLETVTKTRSNSKKLREAADAFQFDQDIRSVGGLVGDDFIPLLGGPFNKQLYYTDYLRMHAGAFHAYNHDPFGRAIVHITRDFTIGRGWRIDWEGTDNKRAEAIWKAFQLVNKFETFVERMAEEISIYGEVMIWFLPNGMKYIVQNPVATDTIPIGIIPRIRLIDPSVIWEIVTHPEDIDRVLYYQWVAPTQYQQYTDGKQPALKFIYQQVPADQVLHHKVNARSNEKRGRSDFFPALGYMKRLRDSVNYSIISLQKNAAWAIDTSIEGDQSDIDNYITDQQELGTIPEAGMEFVHTDKIKREYLGNQGQGRGNSNAFDWALSMIATTVQIPTNYFGTHLSGDQTRASALVATEPVAKKMEQRQKVMGKIIVEIAKRVMREFGINADPEITWPEIVTEDRSAKLADLAIAQNNKWISNKRASQIAAKELAVDNFDYDVEAKQIESEQERMQGPDLLDIPPIDKPLTGPALEPTKTSGLSGLDKKKIKDNKGF